MTRLNKAELSERDKREIWAERQIAAAKRNWRIAGRVLKWAALALLAILLYFAGEINGIRLAEGGRATCDCARRLTP